MSLVARYLEANGIPAIVIGSARDIVEHCGVPRFLFTDFPLGNPCGHPWNPEMQTEILRHALSLLASATGRSYWPLAMNAGADAGGYGCDTNAAPIAEHCLSHSRSPW